MRPRFAILLALLSACESSPHGAPSAEPSPEEVPCLSELEERLAALDTSVDQLQLRVGPRGEVGATGKAGPNGIAGPAGKNEEDGSFVALGTRLDALDRDLLEVEASLSLAESKVAQLSRKPQELLNALGKISLAPPPAKSCKEAVAPITGSYWLDVDGAGPGLPIETWCNFDTDGGGYGWVRLEDASLGEHQADYAAACAKYGMEVVVPRTKAHARAIEAQLGEPPNLVNVFPKASGAQGLANFVGSCRGAPCSFWLSDSNAGDCAGSEPSGDNEVSHRLYRFGAASECDYGHWNDHYDDVAIRGWVICSPNDK